jgi:hypothetical protein
MQPALKARQRVARGSTRSALHPWITAQYHLALKGRQMLAAEDLLKRARRSVGPFRARVLDDSIQGFRAARFTPGSRLNITSP